jgi:hypothetical protein
MSATHVGSGTVTHDRPVAEELSHSTGRAINQAYGLLKFTFTIAPIIAGLDKFFDKLVNWDKYLSGTVSGLIEGRDHQFMMVVGAIEIVAGIGVALKPRIFAYVVTAWLWGIIVNLLLVPGYFDIALRDFGLSLSALALGRLSAHVHRH